MDARREAAELVVLWQELQDAQVAGDAGRLLWLQRRAEAESRHEGASDEWRLLAEDAARNVERLRDELAAQPSAGVGGDEVLVDTDSAPEPVEGRGNRGRIGSLIWLAILVGWIVLQALQGLGEGSP